MSPSEFVCKNAMPGLGCDFYEMLILGIIFCITGLVCLWLLYRDLKSPWGYYLNFFNSHTLFWISMFLWLEYRGILFIFPFNYSKSTLLLFQGSINSILSLIPLSILVLLTCELLFTYKNPGFHVISFYRIVFLVFFFVFLILGIAISFIDDNNEDFTKTLSLWHGCTDLLILFFVTIPSKMLIKAISYPIIQPDDRNCVKISTIGTIIFFILFLIRSIYNISHFLNINPFVSWFNLKLFQNDLISIRIFLFIFSFLFELITSILSIIGIYLFRQHDLKFSADPYYIRDHQRDSLMTQD